MSVNEECSSGGGALNKMHRSCFLWGHLMNINYTNCQSLSRQTACNRQAPIQEAPSVGGAELLSKLNKL